MLKYVSNCISSHMQSGPYFAKFAKYVIKHIIFYLFCEKNIINCSRDSGTYIPFTLKINTNNLYPLPE